MSLPNVRPSAARRPGFWSRRATAALLHLLSGAPPVRVDPPPSLRSPVVGVKKSAICRDARGQLRTIELFLPAGLVTELARPLDIRFLDGEEPVNANELSRAVRSSFAEPGRGA
jgi:hypothetical protein